MDPRTSIGILLAFLLAGVTVLYDCHVSIQERLKRVPVPVFRTPSAILLGMVCGIVAAGAFLFTDNTGTSLVDSVLGLKFTHPIPRGAAVGLMVLVLIRSKLSSLKGAEIGGELLYNTGRTWVMQSLNSRWRAYKSRFNQANQAKALATQGYPERLIAELNESLRIQPEDFRNLVKSQLDNVLRSKPATNFDAALPEWQTYYRTLTNLALDYAGTSVFEGWFDPAKP
ncbi:MAG TPA: hypothetical protein VF532_02735 [Candidatus Angelobacter sp.]